ncbi:epoxyqueuosine reductase QueH [bacterium]|nr:epoxyqueuosine reductase QueH [candidate division CSSED10-310 bacterium]
MPKSRLLMHVCCGPCATHPLQLLKSSFSIEGFFYNPNIFPDDEFSKRLKTTQSYFQKQNTLLIVPKQSYTIWHGNLSKYAEEPEGGRRCAECFRLRLYKTAEFAASHGYDIFTSTLTVGPNKSAGVIFPIAREIAAIFSVKFLEMDFKKKDGFKESCRLSKAEEMYRQNYCGCEFSIRRQS